VRQPEYGSTDCSFLGITYEPAMAEANGFVFQSTRTAACTRRQTPDPSRIQAWKEELSEREIEICESIAGEHLLYLGYDLCFRSNARKMTRMERLSSAIRGYSPKRFRNRLRRRRRRALG
jgi:hypothetical protein